MPWKRLGRFLSEMRELRADRVRLRYALNEISELRERVRVRVLSAESPQFRAAVAQTRQSFESQWDGLPEGRGLSSDPGFRAQAHKDLETWLGHPPAWFRGKHVLDAGCGNGRWSLAFCMLDASVTAIDQSATAVRATGALCAAYPKFAAQVRDTLEPLGMDGRFDLVWHFGVAHHTGNTRGSVENVCRAVKPGGMLFLMIYGEPVWANVGAFVEVNAYEDHRRATRSLGFAGKVAYLRERFDPALVHSWFDAISPLVNDLHRFDEIEAWLVAAGFGEIRRVAENRNHFIRAVRLDA